MPGKKIQSKDAADPASSIESGESPAFTAMTPQSLKAWRKRLGWKQKEAAERLGLKKRMIQYYEKGDRNGRPVEIPLTVRLACHALAQGIADFNGECTSVLPAPVVAKVGAEVVAEPAPEPSVPPVAPAAKKPVARRSKPAKV